MQPVDQQFYMDWFVNRQSLDTISTNSSKLRVWTVEMAAIINLLCWLQQRLQHNKVPKRIFNLELDEEPSLSECCMERGGFSLNY